MGKICKYSNLYSSDGELLRKVDEKTGVLKDYTIEELEQLLDKLGEDKDENGNIKNVIAFSNVYKILMQQYIKYGNPHEKEIRERLEKIAKERGIEEQVQNAMNELKDAIAESTEEEVIKKTDTENESE